MFIIDKVAGKIKTHNSNKFYSWDIIKVLPEYFFKDNDEPYLYESGWLSNLNEDDIEYLISIWENIPHIINTKHFKLLKKNYKKYLEQIIIKNIIK